MSKEYSFSEMIKEYEDGYTGQFRKQDPLEIGYEAIITYKNKDIYYTDDELNELIRVSEDNLRSKFVKIDKEVPVHEAIKALKEGKEIYCMYNEFRTEYEPVSGGAIGKSKLLEGKWFIEE